MTRTSLIFVAALFVSGCDKPSDDACRKAITNMRALLGTEGTPGYDIEGDVRRCKGGSKKKAVECASNAKTVEELRACGFLPSKTKDAVTPPGSAAPGSAAPGSAPPNPNEGSAAPGSAAPGSAAPGSAAPGSAAPTNPNEGPGAGSAAPGSAAPGSAAPGSGA